MQANWNIILNVLLLVGVIVAIGRLMKARKQSMGYERYRPSTGRSQQSFFDSQPMQDDIIAVRKLNTEADEEARTLKSFVDGPAAPRLIPEEEPAEEPMLSAKVAPRVAPAMQQQTPPSYKTASSQSSAPRQEKSCTPTSIMMFLLAKDNKQFAGYELLQTVLASGLRFGEGHLFHRHREANGQGPVLCSLAAATATGVFDLQNIGAFSVRGLCLFMNASQNPDIDAERFSVMLETARQLAEGLDAHLLDAERKPLTQDRLNNYYYVLNIPNEELEYA